MLKPPECIGCPLHTLGQGFSIPEGLGTAGVAIVGEALGFEEYMDGLPFRPRAQAGSKLEECIKTVASETINPISRNSFKLWNIIGCKPPGNELKDAPYEAKAIDHCRVHFERVMQSFVPPNVCGKRVILSLGNIPLKTLTGVTGIAKEKQSISHLRGYVSESPYGLVVPSYHPSFIKRGNLHLTPLLVDDIKRAIGVANGSYTTYKSHPSFATPKYQLHPSLDEAWSFYYKVKDNPKLILAYDIETPDSADVDEDERDELANQDIKMVQFSIGKGTGIALYWNPLFLPVILALFNLPNIKANHNCWNFDNPRLVAKGVNIRGHVHDTMWMFKFWHSRLPRGLQMVAGMFGFPFPWKHLYGSQFEFYGIADVDAVQWILADLPKLMKARGLWEGYKRHIVGMHEVVMGPARERGISVSIEKHEKVRGEFVEIRKSLDTQVQKSVPDVVRNIKPKRKNKTTGVIDYGYVREPKRVSELFDRYTVLSRLLLEKHLSGTKRICSFEDFLYKKSNIAHAKFTISDGTEYGSTEIERWCVIEPFKGSSTQLIRYLRWKQGEIHKDIEELVEKRELEFKGKNRELTQQINELKSLAEDYEVPKIIKTKGGKRQLVETTGKSELEEVYLNTGDPLLEQVAKVRSLDTNLNNFLPNWLPGRDGRVHPTFGYTAPTGQLDARRPNTFNCSKHTEYGNIFREIVEAPVGYTFIEFDKKSFHVAMLGQQANDKNYIRFSQLDPHSILGSHIDPSIIGGSIDLRWNDSDIKLACKEFKARCKQVREKDPIHGVDVRQTLAKPTVLGNQLELGARKLQRQNRRYIKTVAEAERFQDILNGMFVKIPPFKKKTKEEAFYKKYLMNEFGFIQYFYDIYKFTYNKHTCSWERKESEGAREPIAFRVQSPSFGMIQVEMLEMGRRGVLEEHNFVNTIHDSVIFMPEVGKVEKCMEEVMGVMNAPCRYLVNDATGEEGLVVKVEASMGRNWRAWDGERNKEGMREVKN